MSDRNCVILDHPVLQHHLTELRDRATEPPRFRRILGEISRFIAYEATRDLPSRKCDVETPMEKMKGAPAVSTDLLIVSVMRAGNGMLDSTLDLLPFAQVGHIGIYRDKFLNSTVEYFFRVPESAAGEPALLLDPLLATGDTAVSAIQRLKDYGVGEIRVLSLLASEQGLAKLYEAHPEVKVFCLSVERALNDSGYLLPGIGDAGDRLYGTEV